MLENAILGDTLVEMFLMRVQATPKKEAFRVKERMQWRSKTWKEVESAVCQTAGFLYSKGLRFGDRMGFLSHTRADVFIVELAAQSLGATVVPIYASNISEDILHILRESRAKVLVVEGLSQFRKVQSLLPELPELRSLMSVEKISAPECENLSLAKDDPSFSSEEWRKTWQEICQKVTSGTLAALMFTSGTTGLPKAVPLTHRNFVEVLKNISLTLDIDSNDVSLLFLPVAHIMGRIEQLLSIHVGLVNAYAGGIHSLKSDFLEVQPTVLLAVPRVFEKLYENILIQKSASWMNEILDWGAKKSSLLNSFVAVQIRDRVRRGFGGRLRFALVGGAPLRQDVFDFFNTCEVSLLQGYGLTETAGPISVNRPKQNKGGSVGKPLADIEIKISEEGEIFCRAPQISSTYLIDGWFHTGDVGFLDSDGYLHITDRKKDIIVTSNGKNIAPLKLEAALLSTPLFQSAIVVGHGKPFVSVLLVLEQERARQMASQHRIPFDDFAELIQNPIFLAYVQNEIDLINQKLAPHEVIKKFSILDQALSVESGELTPTYKIRRQYCEKKYREMIDNLYISGAL